MPAHDFRLLTETHEHYADWDERHDRPADVVLHDDIVSYIFDTLRWIPTINPANPANWSGFGLNYHGPTVINSAGAPSTARILRHWAGLFLEGPPTLELRGSFQWIEGEAVDTGEYERINVDRDELVRDLSALADLAERVSTGQNYLLHWGV
jgi:hypothetical protein